jgi:hypothetical protein
MDLWTEYLGRWLSFRGWLFRQYGVPANFELHSQAWLSVEPAKHTDAAEQLALVQDDDGALLDVLRRGRVRRKSRFEIVEKGLKTIGTFTEARLFTVGSPDTSGMAKIVLYDELLCFVEDFLSSGGGHGTFIVDGAHDSGGHLRSAHRALLLNHRRIVEDAGLRRSSDSQLLQMADGCAHAAFQSVQNKASLDEKFRRQYETTLSRLIAGRLASRTAGAFGAWTTKAIRPAARASGSLIGLKNTSPGLPGLVSRRTVGSPE